MTDPRGLRGEPVTVDVVVVGGGPAGLAVAGCLARRGIAALVLDRAARIGDSWRERYDRLCLHTTKALSALPGLDFAEAAPRYVPRDQVASYLEDYACCFGIAPRLGTEVAAITRSADRWQVASRDGTCVVAPCVVLATGANAVAERPPLTGEDGFDGRLLHASDYRNAAPFDGQRVLVVGLGNTGAEIALDLAEHGIDVAVSVRSPVNVVRRDVLGRPTQQTAILLSRLPRPLAYAIAARLRDWTVGDLAPHGLGRPATSPLQDLVERGRTPLIDVGTIARIRDGSIGVFPAIATLEPGGARFVDGRSAPFDVVVLATGYRAAVRELFPDLEIATDAAGRPLLAAGQSSHPGLPPQLHFIGFDLRQPGGLLRAIGHEAERIATAISAARIHPGGGPS